MFGNTKAFSGFAVDDIETARQFYAETLGLEVTEAERDADPAPRAVTGRSSSTRSRTTRRPSFTILNFPVDDIEAAVDQLTARGVGFERYEGTPAATDEKGIFRGGGPLIAWFTDPAGNVLSVVEAEGPQ